VSHAGIERRILTKDAEIIKIDMESGNGADRDDAIKAPEGLPRKGLPRVGTVIEDAAPGNDWGRAKGIDSKG
jgi:hypothetical protein